MPAFRSTLPVHADHVAIVLGKNFTTLNKIKHKFKVGLHFNRAEPEQNRPLPYFVVCGIERDVHLCINEIQRLVIISMTNYIKRIKPNHGTGGNYGEQFTRYRGDSNKVMVHRDSGLLITPPPVASVDPPKTPDYSAPEMIIAPVPDTKKKNQKVTFVTN
jgi:hypothetical protein